MDNIEQREPRIVVVGPCAAGKTTLVGSLRRQGFNVHSCAQEHSSVARLWRKRCRADVLLYLDAGLETIARRQNRTDWTTGRLDAQRRRLADARVHCDLYLCTDDLSRDQVAGVAAEFLRNLGIVPEKRASDD
jgi:hypothetical protein